MKKIYTIAACAMALLFSGNAAAQTFVEEFDDTTTTFAAGWSHVNMSNPPGTNNVWFDGNSTVFAANSGAGYIAVNYNSTAGAGTISQWLFSPTRTLMNGDMISFWTRTVDTGGTVYPDRLQVRLSQSGNSVDVGVDELSFGDFDTLLLDINPTYSAMGFPTGYPHFWNMYSITLAGLPSQGVSGKFAFRYFVENGGPSGANSDYIGIDLCTYTAISSINEHKNDLAFYAYPNPSNGIVNINLQNTSIGDNKTIVITNLIGQEVYRSEIKNFNGSEISLNLSDLAKGAYFINVSDKTSNGTKKLIIE
jgi:hypothetical protein